MGFSLKKVVKSVVKTADPIRTTKKAIEGTKEVVSELSHGNISGAFKALDASTVLPLRETPIIGDYYQKNIKGPRDQANAARKNAQAEQIHAEELYRENARRKNSQDASKADIGAAMTASASQMLRNASTLLTSVEGVDPSLLNLYRGNKLSG